MQHSDGFLPHTTTTCPVPANTPTTIKLRSGRIVETNRPQDWLWGRAPSINPGFANGGEIVAYRTLEEAA